MVEYYTNVMESFPSYLNDESSIANNPIAERIYFPKTSEEVVDVVNDANQLEKNITVSGGGTGLSGGRVPPKDWILATDKLTKISGVSKTWIDPETNNSYNLSLKELNHDFAELIVPAAMTLKSVQNFVREKRWFYPPDPTERTSFIAGNVATNASGARTFKFGPTRMWVQGIKVVIADGSLLNLRRDIVHGKVSTLFISLKTGGAIIEIPRPSYEIPDVTKNVAGPVIDDDSDPMDLFIGSNGIFGIITEVTLKLIRPPTDILSIFVSCTSMDQAFEFIQICQERRDRNNFPVPMSVEFLDDRAIKIMRLHDERLPEGAEAIIMIEQDLYNEDQFEKALDKWNDIFESMQIIDASVAQTNKEIEHHKFLRHCVPEYVIQLTKSYKQKLIASDNSVPNHNFRELFYYLLDIAKQFEDFQKNRTPQLKEPGFVFFGHAGDSHPHLALLPRNEEEASFANQLLVRILHKIVELDGAIAAEHGLGKKRYEGNPAIFLQYGQIGLDAIKAMKEVLDPKMLLCPGNLINNKA